MEEDKKSSRSNLKRPFSTEDDDSNKPPAAKRVRFPKGKKVKPGEQVVVDTGRAEECGPSERIVADARLAAKERAKSRSKITTELFSEQSTGILHDISAAEVNYEESESMLDGGIQLEPFNLDREREEGYFDADGNFVEYVNANEVKDAWLDSVEVDQRFAGRHSSITKDAEDTPDLSPEEIGKIKRHIADLLEPDETVLQALKRMKGNSNNKKEKMSAETKLVFDQLTEYAMKLMDNGDYNVYHERQEVFEREAEGYERLAWAKGEGTSISVDNGQCDLSEGKDLFSNVINSGVPSSVVPDIAVGSLMAEITSGNGDEAFDMFAENDENSAVNPSSDGSNLLLGPGSNTISQPSEVLNADSSNGALQNDYVYEESSGYYYSSSLGYYYDPSSGLYCYAASGQWYSYNEETSTYDEFHEDVTSVGG